MTVIVIILIIIILIILASNFQLQGCVEMQLLILYAS